MNNSKKTNNSGFSGHFANEPCVSLSRDTQDEINLNNKKDIKVALIDGPNKISLDYVQKQLERHVKEVTARKARGEKEIELVDYISLVNSLNTKFIPSGLSSSNLYEKIKSFTAPIIINLETGNHSLNSSCIRNPDNNPGFFNTVRYTEILNNRFLSTAINHDDLMFRYDLTGGKYRVKEELYTHGDWIKKANTVKHEQIKNKAKPSKLILTILKGRK